ncbi:MAG: hypothetical protein PHI31_09980 [Desulfuromonadaceae bacterium]|nr:hypothetical protein [Desulfuromonadaceae bacterium]
MGCDFFYDGSLSDASAQEKVISLAKEYYENAGLTIIPTDNIYPSRIANRNEKRRFRAHIDPAYPFNYFGIIPFPNYYFIEHGQFVFDRTQGGKLVSLLKVPREYDFEWAPWDLVKVSDYIEGYVDEPEEYLVEVREGGYTRCGGYSFATLLNVIRLRWIPELQMGDDGDACMEVRAIIERNNLQALFKDESVCFAKCDTTINTILEKSGRISCEEN